jgi:hypothetical protein
MASLVIRTQVRENFFQQGVGIVGKKRIERENETIL